MCSVRKHEKWLLVESNDGAKEVVNIKRVINSAEVELAIGSKVTLAGIGENDGKVGKIIAAARDFRTLERFLESPQKKPQEAVATGSPVQDQEPKDFSSSASSWEPSGDSSSSDSSEEEEEKPNMRIRQYFNKSGKVLTPCSRVNAIIPNVMQSKKDSNVNVPPKRRKRTLSDTRGVKTAAARKLNDCSKRNTSLVNTNNPGITDAYIIQDLTTIDRCFRDIFKMLKEWKTFGLTTTRVSTQELDTTVNIVQPSNIEEIPPEANYNNNENSPIDIPLAPMTQNSFPTPKIVKNENPTINTVESDCDEYRSDEFNRSDDNILISNKYATVAQSTPIPRKTENPKAADKGEWIPIGSGQTLIHKNQYTKINWKSYTVATRTLLLAVFPRKILATHSLTGKRSPAFQNLQPKMCLDQRIVQDVIMEIQDRFNVKENLIRTIITTKCADECKMMKMQQKRKSTPKKISTVKNENFANETC